jgi:hypothetical protein
METHQGWYTVMALAGVLMVAAVAVMAEESGTGHYNPGQTADFGDSLPGYPSFAYMNIFTYYHGSAGGSQRLPISGGRVAVDLEATSYSETSVLLWETPLKVFGGYYSLFVSIPYVWLTVSGDVQIGPRTGQTKDSTNGIGDIYFAPLAIGWSKGDCKWDGRFGIYAPTGEYDKTDLANPGLGYWTFEPEVTFSWLSSKIGTEVSVFAGFDFNTENTEANYTSGDIFHIDLTVAQHLPLLGGVIGVGANGYWYKQFTGDSGSGATLGNFKAQELGIGPVVSYIRKMGKKALVIDAKWLPQIDVQNTMKGDYVWAKAALVF